MKKWIAAAAVGAFALGGVVAHSANAMDKEGNIVVGYAGSSSGWMQNYSVPPTNAGLIMIEELNAAGGLLGKKVVPIFADGKTDRVESAKAGQTVVDQGADLVMVDCDYDFGAPAALAAENAKKISIFLCAESALAGIDGVGPHSFSGSVLAAVQGAIIAEWGFKKKGWKSAYILLDDVLEYNKGICYGFDWMWKKLGGKILGHDVFKNEDPSIAPQITRIKGLKEQPDLIEMCSYVPGGASAIKQIRAAGINAALGQGSSMTGSHWWECCPNLTGVYIPEQGSIYGDDPNPKVEEFNKLYAKKYGARPESQYMYPGYVGIYVWSLAVKRAGTIDADKVVAEMEKMKDEPTLFGPRTFTNKLHHQNIAEMRVIEVTAGKGHVAEVWKLTEAVPQNVFMGQEYKY
jgi:branched-chain amino acid transport system substrate-binding protein